MNQPDRNRPADKADSTDGAGPRGSDSKIMTYAVPFVAALLVAFGIAGAVLGGWAVVQPSIGACDDPIIAVSSPDATEERVEGDGVAVETLAADDLTSAEQRALEEAIDDPQREGVVRGAFDNRVAFERGVVVTVDGSDRYAALASDDRCLSVDPLVLPLGAASLVVGLVAFAIVAVLNYPWRFGL